MTPNKAYSNRMQRNKAKYTLISYKKGEEKRWGGGGGGCRISSVTEQTVALAWIRVLSGWRFLIPTERWW